MSAADLWEVSLTVADRFKMQPSEINGLRLSEIMAWYEGAIRLYKRDAGE